MKLPDSIRVKLRVYAWRRRWVESLTGLFLSLVIVAAAIGCGILADRLTLGLSTFTRWAIFVGMFILFTAIFFRKALWAALQPRNTRKAAIGLGRHFPDMAEDLLTAVELSETSSEKSFSASLILSALHHISERTRRIDPRLAVSLRPLAETAGMFLVILAALFVAYLMAPEAISNAVARLLRPGRDVPFFSYTQLQVQPGETIIRRGDSLDVSLTVRGRLVENALLELESTDSITAKIPISSGTGSWKSGALFENVRYRVTAGDAVAGWFNVRVLPAPALRAKSALIIAPEYAGSHQTQIDPLPSALTLISGSALFFRFETAPRGQDPRLQCSGRLIGPSESVELSAKESLLISPKILPKESGEYTLLLQDGFGLVNRAAATVSIRVVPDALPHVAVTHPGENTLALPEARVNIVAAASDDLGLRYLRLLVRRIKSSGETSTQVPWQEINLAEGGQEIVSLRGAYEIVPAALGAVPGDRIEYKAASADFAGEPQVRTAYSDLRTIVIISELEHLEIILQQLRGVQGELLQLAARQGMEARQTERLMQNLSDSNILTEAAQGSERQTDLARSGENAFEKLEKILEELAHNPRAPLEMMAELSRLAEALRNVAQGPMTQAAQNLTTASHAPTPTEAAPHLGQARNRQEEAQRDLQNLARLLERMQRRSLLEKLADEAERLAALQLELRETTGRLAVELAGVAKEPQRGEALPPSLQRLILGQQNIHSGIVNLAQDIGKAKTELSRQHIREAAALERAGALLLADETASNAADICRQLERNRLFNQLPRQAKIAATLKEVARILREAAESDDMPHLTKEIEEFIKRQKELNAGMEAIIADAKQKEKPQTLAEHQSTLERDVREHAAAIEFLAKNLELYEIKTPELLNKAANFMNQAAAELFALSVPKGLEYGRKALAALEEARETLQQEQAEMEEAAQEQQNEMPIEAILLLMRIISGQKRVLADTTAADKVTNKNTEQFTRLVVMLAQQQGALRKDIGELMRMIPQAAMILNPAAQEMETSYRALQAGDTGENTRIVQRRVIAILEALLREQGQSGRGRGAGGSAAAAMRRAMAATGGGMGGNEGGENAPIEPSRLSRTDEETWRRMRSKFEENLGAGFQSEYSSEFRGLLNAYFDALRKGPERK